MTHTPPAPVLEFLLVPDAGAARRVRRLVAEQGARGGLLVGSWPELLEVARYACLAPPPDGTFAARLAAAMQELPDAAWAASLAVAPRETTAAVVAALTDLLAACDPLAPLAVTGLDELPDRPRRHVADLLRLAAALDGRLPDELAAIQAVLQADLGTALRGLRVVHLEDWPPLSRWQAALVAKLNVDARVFGAGGDDGNWLDLLRRVAGGGAAAGDGAAPGALGVLQQQLYRPPAAPAARDDSVQWVGVRDFLQEAEVAAGMVQKMLAADPSLRPADIGVLVPDGFEYAIAVEDAFRLAGIGLAGLPVERWRRDLGREAVFHFLYCRHKPAPAMALAVCLSSPLMPWSREQGATFAQAVMDGDYSLTVPAGADAATRALLELLRDGDSEPATLGAALARFAALLGGGEVFAAHLREARAAVDELGALLAGAAEIDWTALRRAVTPHLLTNGEAPLFTLEGLTVWRESQEPWRAVRRLLVLGFAQDHYPASLAANPVFTAADLEAIRKALALPLTTPAAELAQRRERLRRQLAAVSEAVTFLVPHRNSAGELQGPSDSLVFMHRLFAAGGEAEELIATLDVAADRARVRDLASAAPAAPRPPRPLPLADLEFGRDLLAVRAGRDGRPRPQSPSSLERLMVSGLAWLLHELRAEPLHWSPEAADPMVLGTVAHKVFEGLFRPDAPLPPRDEIPARVAALLEELLPRLAPFLRAPQWSLERSHFTAQTIQAALAWQAALGQLGAEVLASEEWLAGNWQGIAIHGQTDLILGLPGERLLVVDYKRSRSAGRLKQMQNGLDSQASLYRAMLASGGPTGPRRAALAARLRAAREISVAYYLLNDQAVLADVAVEGATAIPGWRTLDNDIAGEALGLIGARLEELRRGQLRLNRAGDEHFFERQGVRPHALELSPLIRRFSWPAVEAEAKEEE